VDKKCGSCGCVNAVTSTHHTVVAVYCKECQQKLINKKFTASDGHRQTNRISHADSAVKPQKSSIQLIVEHSIKINKPMVCEDHSGEPLSVYCDDCGLEICVVCRTNKHSRHKCFDMRQVTDNRQQLQSDIDSVIKVSQEYVRILEKLADDRQTLEDRANKIEQAISDGASLLMDEVERNKDKLLAEITSVRQMRVKQIDEVFDEVEMRLVSVDGLKRYTEELANRGTAGDIAREIGVLHARSDDLNRRETINKSLKSIGTITIQFTPTEWQIENKNIIGDFECHLQGCKKGKNTYLFFLLSEIFPLNNKEHSRKLLKIVRGYRWRGMKLMRKGGLL